MSTIFDLLYREYCRARLVEMRKQLLISPKRHEVPEAFCDEGMLARIRQMAVGHPRSKNR